MSSKILSVFVISLTFIISISNGEVVSNEIYSLDNSDGGKVLSIAVNSETKSAVLQEFTAGNGYQRFIARVNSDNTFTLFTEQQPWDWVDHIVETSKHVNIKQIPQVLGVVGGSKQVVEQDYAGKNSNGQKFYIVPNGDDANTGVITNLLLRECITGQGENQPLTIVPCSFNDPNQQFTFAARSSGRFS